jgi:hypothetical protein
LLPCSGHAGQNPCCRSSAARCLQCTCDSLQAPESPRAEPLPQGAVPTRHPAECNYSAKKLYHHREGRTNADRRPASQEMLELAGRSRIPRGNSNNRTAQCPAVSAMMPSGLESAADRSVPRHRQLRITPTGECGKTLVQAQRRHLKALSHTD